METRMDYKIAANGSDYRRAHAFIRSLGLEQPGLNFPTLLAIDDDGALRGILGTNTEDGFIYAGPLLVDGTDKRRLWTVIRLVEMYELIMRHVGVTEFIFNVPAEEEKWREYIERTIGLTPYAEQDGHFFYKRVLT